MRRFLCCAVLLCCLLFVTACGGGEPSATEPSEAPETTQATTEETRPETTVPETTQPETTPSETTIPETTQPEPTQETTEAVAAPTVRKRPTSELVYTGDDTLFIAHAEHAEGVRWHLISPEGQSHLPEEVARQMPGLEITGAETDALVLKHVPLQLNGWSVQAEFYNAGGSIFTRPALITVRDRGDVLDYAHTDMSDWNYFSGRDGNAALLDSINNVPYGAAGSGMGQACAAIQMIRLSTKPDGFASVKAYMAEMTPIQRDYFNFSWTMVSDTAQILFVDFPSMKGTLDSAGQTDFDINDYRESDFRALNTAVWEYFKEQNVTGEWKNHMEREPFNNFESP